MITPNIIYYARLSLERNGSKTPKYVITATAGNYAPTVRTYTVKGKEKPNPLYGYENDGFLFIIHQDETATSETEKIIPSEIELIVLEGAKVLIPSYCKQLCMGGFNEILSYLRKQSNVL